MKVNLQPLGDYVVAQTEEPATKTASGLYLPDRATEKSQIAKVLAVGSEVKKVKVGDNIVYKNFSSSEVKVGANEYLMIKEEDIVATVK